MIHILNILSSQKKAYRPVFLIAGQSNATGYDSGVPDNTSQFQNVEIYTGTAWENLQYPTNNEGFLNLNHGIEIRLAELIESYYTLSGHIIKLGEPSTSLAQRPAIDWNTASFELYDDLITKVSNGLNALSTSGIDNVIKGLVWIQGESDGQNESEADAYESNLTSLITNFRSVHGNVAFVLVKVNSSLSIYYPYIGTVRAAMDNVASSLPNVSTIDTLDAVYTASNVHYTKDYLKIIAERAFDIIK